MESNGSTFSPARLKNEKRSLCSHCVLAPLKNFWQKLVSSETALAGHDDTKALEWRNERDSASSATTDQQATTTTRSLNFGLPCFSLFPPSRQNLRLTDLPEAFQKVFECLVSRYRGTRASLRVLPRRR